MQKEFKDIKFSEFQQKEILKERGWEEIPLKLTQNNPVNQDLKTLRNLYNSYWVKPYWTDKEKNLFKMYTFEAFNKELPLLEYEYKCKKRMYENTLEKDTTKNLVELFSNPISNFKDAFVYQLGTIIQKDLEVVSEEVFKNKKYELGQGIALEFITQFVRGNVIPLEDESTL